MSISQALKRLFTRSGAATPPSSNVNDLVYVKNFQNRLEAEMAKGFLDSQGIQSIVSVEDRGGTAPMMAAVMGGARLLVRRADAEKALELLQSEGSVALSDE